MREEALTPSIRLGRIFGIEIGFNWSLIFIFAWITWLLATAILPANASGYPPLVYWIVAALGAIMFYACLLAHELSHALVARSHGVKVAGITLWLFGGVSRLEGEPTSARALQPGACIPAGRWAAVELDPVVAHRQPAARSAQRRTRGSRLCLSDDRRRRPRALPRRGGQRNLDRVP